MDPVSLPLFPLQSVLFPGGLLALRIFEVRYLDLIRRCHKEGAPFGVVCMTLGSEVRQPPRDIAPDKAQDFEPEAFHAVGTLAHIAELKQVQPGLMLLRCTGGLRFRLSSSEQLKHGLWVGEASWLADEPRVLVPADLGYVQLALRRLVAHIQANLGPTDTLPLLTPFGWDDCGWVANRWCELLPVSTQLKQQLMMLENPLLRLELVTDLLERLKIVQPGAPP